MVTLNQKISRIRKKYLNISVDWNMLEKAYEEIERYATSYNMPQNLKHHIDVGRHRGLGLFCTARRTKRTNPDILFNADHIFIFHQTRPEDVEYLADFVGETALKISGLPEYYFIYYSDREGTTTIMQKIGEVKQNGNVEPKNFEDQKKIP